MELGELAVGLLAIAGLISGLNPLGSLLVKFFKMLFEGRDWVKAQDDQTDEIEKLKNETSERFSEVYKTHNEAVKEIKEEQTLIVYGTLACLKGLAEQGCDGPVHDAINKFEKYLNQKAHE